MRRELGQREEEIKRDILRRLGLAPPTARTTRPTAPEKTEEPKLPTSSLTCWRCGDAAVALIRDRRDHSLPFWVCFGHYVAVPEEHSEVIVSPDRLSQGRRLVWKLNLKTMDCPRGPWGRQGEK